MPTRLPLRSTSAPPLLPGLIAASVWMAGYVVALPWPSEPTLTGRSSALTMPLVTVASRPSGEPIATTPWPTARSLDLPMSAGVRPETSWAWISAVSVSGSVPRIVASAWLPSLKVTRSVPPSPASSTTWLLVRIWPSELRMIPEPEPEPWLPLTSIFTTEGSTLLATASTLPSAAGESGVSTTLEVLTGLEAPEPPLPGSSCQAEYAAAPPMPAPPPTSSEAATMLPANAIRRRRDSRTRGGAAAGPGRGGLGRVGVRRRRRPPASAAWEGCPGAGGGGWCPRRRSQEQRCRPEL